MPVCEAIVSDPSEREREYEHLTAEEKQLVLNEVERFYWAGALDLSAPEKGDDAVYPPSPEGTVLAGQRLTYTHRGRRYCGWCSRPAVACEEEPCPTMQ